MLAVGGVKKMMGVIVIKRILNKTRKGEKRSHKCLSEVDLDFGT